MNYRLLVAYDGTRYYGWQATAFGPSIQHELEAAAHAVLCVEVRCEAASRTDRGVHARGQVVQLQADKSLAPERLWLGMNAHLPSDIRVYAVEVADDAFHATLDARAKTYCYDLCLGPVQLPFHRKFSWHYHHDVDLERMRRGASALCGTHNFAAFTTEPDADSVRTLHRLEVLRLPDERLRIAMSGDRFLYKMARTLAGTLANIGSGKLAEELVPELLQAPDRRRSGITAPAHGLTLHRVHYSIDEIQNVDVYLESYGTQ